MSSLIKRQLLCLPAVLHFSFHNRPPWEKKKKKRGHILPKMHHDLAFAWPHPPWCDVWPWAGSHISHFLSNQNGLLWPRGWDWHWDWARWRDWSSVAERNRKKKKEDRHLTFKIRERPTFHNFSYFTEHKIATASPLSLSHAQTAYFRPPLLFRDNSVQLVLFTGHRQPERWNALGNDLTLASMEKTLTGLRTHTAARMLAHYLTPPLLHLCLPATWH